MDDQSLLEVLAEAAAAVRSALDRLDDWRSAGSRPGQYRLDQIADVAALSVLHGAGFSVLSEESGLTRPSGGSAPKGAPMGNHVTTGASSGDGLMVVVDPVDGSTNASLGLPWFATSLCVLDGGGARTALVVNQATGVRFEAIRGGGARRDGHPIQPSGCRTISEAVIGISGFPPSHPGWSQFRALGSAALDLCAVAEGVLDGYLLVGGSWLHAWDYLGGMLVCSEAGAAVGELYGNDLVTRDDSLRSPVAAATPDLLEELLLGAA